MRRLTLSVVLLLGCFKLSFADDPVRIVREIDPTPTANATIQRGRMLKLRVEGDNITAASWLIFPFDGVYDTEISDQGRRCAFTGEVGVYNIAATVWNGTSLVTQRWIVVVQAGPTPPGPGPQPPNPIPPDPPAPVDPLVTSIKAAYATETLETKAKVASKIADFYQNVGPATVADPNLQTVGQLKTSLESKRDWADNAIVATRRVIGDYVNGQIPRDPNAPLDAQTRTAIISCFRRVSTALMEAIK